MTHSLDGISVLDVEGRQTPLDALWRDHASVIVFVRHFGCIFCMEQVAVMRQALPDIRHLGAELVVIGHGTPAHAREFRDAHASDLLVLTDPTRTAYCALDMPRSLSTSVSPLVFWRAFRAYLRGFRQTHVAGDALQQGGVIVIDAGGAELFRHISQSAGDHPSPRAVIAALAASRGGRHPDSGHS